MCNGVLRSLADFRGFAALLLLAGMPASTRGADATDRAAKPNVLFILADDFRSDCVAALGNRHIRTPSLDTLAERGMSFSRAYCNGSMIGAVCAPSRTMLLTGRSLFHLPGPKAPGTQYALWPKAMRAGGYETFHLGKKGNSFVPGMEAFDICRYTSADNGARAQSSQEAADGVLRYLRDRKDDKPFFIYLAPPVPHDPRVAPREFMALYDPASLPLPASFRPLHPFDNGEMTVRDELLAPHPRTAAVVRRHLADYYACISCFDHHVGRILEFLKQSRQLDNTIVIFTGDNGLSLGDHGLLGKQNLYEYGGMHVPLVIAGPGIPRGKSDALVYLYDLFPTVCELTQTPVPPLVDGKSLVPVIAGKAPKVRDCLFTAYRDVQRAVRDDRWKLIRYPQINKSQLFDLRDDPHELHDLADKPEYAAKVKELTARLAVLQAEAGDNCKLSSPNPKDPAWLPPK
jgi:arylsulfatase A-like enzyme